MNTDIPPPFYSLPEWPAEPPPVDPAGTSYVVVAIGGHARTREVARAWVEEAEAAAPTVLAVLDSMSADTDRATFGEVLAAARTGCRLLLVGGQYDVLTASTAAHDAGALPGEIAAFVVDTGDAPIHCAHCRAPHRVAGGPGDEVTCPGCGRLLEIHPHLAWSLGCFLASDAHAMTL
ncbi:hypothetical protein LY13_001456 [Prauserella aidingensis]|uniref:dimethylamine monooxygenase subunit DmmA family protein n=1 Tax=Prauserella aidingensis TaxID=387890 RepID=UPI0020A29C4D|nr:dimethylamine monooxygenase subunit DmmA family protein [Prauserella aidingensis]MCP2252713.1 hypothetical protein [Prauserella aidingensis]